MSDSSQDLNKRCRRSFLRDSHWTCEKLLQQEDDRSPLESSPRPYLNGSYRRSCRCEGDQSEAEKLHSVLEIDIGFFSGLRVVFSFCV